jgi:hypothetical protein
MTAPLVVRSDTGQEHVPTTTVDAVQGTLTPAIRFLNAPSAD